MLAGQLALILAAAFPGGPSAASAQNPFMLFAGA